MTYVLYVYSISNRTHTSHFIRRCAIIHCSSLSHCRFAPFSTLVWNSLTVCKGWTSLITTVLMFLYSNDLISRTDTMNTWCFSASIPSSMIPLNHSVHSPIKSSRASGDFIPSLNFCHGSVTWTMEELIAPASKLISYRVLDTKDELIVVGYSPTKWVHSSWTI